MTVRQLLANCDSRELTEWEAYYIVKGQDDEKRRKKGNVSLEEDVPLTKQIAAGMDTAGQIARKKKIAQEAKAIRQQVKSARRS